LPGSLDDGSLEHCPDVVSLGLNLA
jgi:hypothetical protein